MRDRKRSIPGDGIWSGDTIVALIQRQTQRYGLPLHHKDVCANVIIEENQMSESKKCENPACSCIPEKGQNFCSAHCEGTKGATEVVCECGHPSCKGDATRV
jgi:hypothetical protein